MVHRELQSIERTNRRKPGRPSRQYSYGSQLGPEPFDRKATNENESKDGSRMITSHQFVITGDKSAEDLTLCCLNDMRNAVEDTVEEILEIFQNENRKLHSYNKNSQSRTLFYDTSIQYLLFTNLIQCPGSYSSVAVKFVTELTMSESNTGMNSQKLNQKIIESVHNGDMKLSMYRYGFPSSDILSLQAMLCPGETLKPSATPSVVPTVRQPTVNAVSLLFQVSLAGGKSSIELSECCREQVLNGAKKSLSAVLDGLSGRRHLDTKKRRYLEKENEIMAIEVDNFWDNPDCPNGENCVEVSYDMWVTKDPESDGESLKNTLKSDLNNEVREGSFTENLKSEGLDVKATIPITDSPSFQPSVSLMPTSSPTLIPTLIPTSSPTLIPTSSPSSSPTWTPSSRPSFYPSRMPSAKSKKRSRTVDR